MEMKPSVVSKPCTNPNGCRGTLRLKIGVPVGSPSRTPPVSGGGTFWQCDTCGAKSPYIEPKSE
jgi:hypothetical protein